MHRYHHQYVDSEKDPYSPIIGFWFSHMSWLFDNGYIFEKYQERNNVEDLKNQAFLKRTYALHTIAFAALLYVVGGFSYIVWVLGVAGTLGYHGTFLVNSVCHIWGSHVWNTGDLFKNYWWVALLSFGEGWQIDVGWYIIRFLEVVGLATNVKLPSKDHKLKMSFASLNKFE
ncbi:putative acyl-CoA desaturase [Helianthus debilis subsp. tardiflorus]